MTRDARVGCRRIRPGWVMSPQRRIPTAIRPTILNVTTFLKLISPFLCAATRFLYIPSGDDPVGKPKTKGFSSVGPKDFIRPNAALSVRLYGSATVYAH